VNADSEDLKRWDVALSFAAADEALALQLKNLLEPQYSVFVYSKAQEELVGRDGIEAFRTVFLERSELIVVLFADPWGTTPWTIVEQDAIQERVIRKDGWDHLLFVRVREQAMPKWVPPSRLYMNLSRFSLTELAGAIKSKLLELGIDKAPPTPAARAAAIKIKHDFDAETLAILGRGSREYDEAVERLRECIAASASEIAKSTGWRVACGPAAILGGYAVTCRGQSLRLESKRRYLNSTEDCYCELTEWDTGLTIQQPGQIYHWSDRPPSPRKTHRLTIRRLPELGWCWELDGRIRGAEDTAEAVLHILVSRIEAKGVNRL
jgi:hypothetical protein